MIAILEIALYIWIKEAVTLTEIALKQNILFSYLRQILVKLKKANLVRLVKRSKGAYIINVQFDKIKIVNIIDVVYENIEMTKCLGNAINSCITSKVNVIYIIYGWG